MIGRFEESVLSVLLEAKGEVKTIEIHQSLTTQKPVSIGAIYVTLDRMGKKGLIQRRKGEPLPERGGKARLFYKITSAGRAALIEAQLNTFYVNPYAKIQEGKS